MAAFLSPKHYCWLLGFVEVFTTFSAFALENQNFLKTGDYTQFLVYTIGSLFLGVFAVILGLFISKNI
jgi:CrcB protein